MDFTSYIDAALLVLIPVLYLIGNGIKSSGIDNKHIPLILGATGIVLAVVWVLATSDITGWQGGLLAAFTAIVQGVLCAGAAVYTNQLIKQEGGSNE